MGTHLLCLLFAFLPLLLIRQATRIWADSRRENQKNISEIPAAIPSNALIFKGFYAIIFHVYLCLGKVRPFSDNDKQKVLDFRLLHGKENVRMGFFQNTRKPEGLGGKIMVHMMNSGHSSLAEWGFSHIEVQEDFVSLDIGCGGGANIKRLLEKSPLGKVVGIDYSDVSVKKSKKLNQKEIDNSRCEVLQGDVMQLPFEEKTFDLITAFETVYFWPDLRKAFELVYRALKNGGMFMICNEANGENPKDEKWADLIQGMKIYTAEQIKRFLEEAGFADIRIDQNEKSWLCVICKK